jgi:hypothetical protein
MKNVKVVFVSAVFLFLMVVPVFAAQLDGLIGAGAGYLSSVDYVAVAFNAYAGQGIVFIGLPLQYSNTVGFCGLSSYSAMGSILAYGDTSIHRWMEMPFDDFYVYLCLKMAGLSGNFAIATADLATFSGASVAPLSDRSAESVPADLKAKLQEHLSQAFKQISGE